MKTQYVAMEGVLRQRARFGSEAPRSASGPHLRPKGVRGRARSSKPPAYEVAGPRPQGQKPSDTAWRQSVAHRKAHLRQTERRKLHPGSMTKQQERRQRRTAPGTGTRHAKFEDLGLAARAQQ